MLRWDWGGDNHRFTSRSDKFEDYFNTAATNIRTLMIRQGKLDRWHKAEQVFVAKITIMPQDERMSYGNGRPVTARDLVEHDDAFVVMWGDDMVLGKVSAAGQIVDYFHKHTCDGVLAVQEVDDDEVDRYGIVKLKPGSDVRRDSKLRNRRNQRLLLIWLSYGRYVLTPKVFEQFAIRCNRTGWRALVYKTPMISWQHGDVRVKVVDMNGWPQVTQFRYMKSHQIHAAHEGYGPELAKWLRTFIKPATRTACMPWSM